VGATEQVDEPGRRKYVQDPVFGGLRPVAASASPIGKRRMTGQDLKAYEVAVNGKRASDRWIPDDACTCASVQPALHLIVPTHNVLLLSSVASLDILNDLRSVMNSDHSNPDMVQALRNAAHHT